MMTEGKVCAKYMLQGATLPCSCIKPPPVSRWRARQALDAVMLAAKASMTLAFIKLLKDEFLISRSTLAFYSYALASC
jgi:hypothetical protein